MSIDVENLYDRRADNRWDRVSVGDILERMSWSEPDKIAFIAAPDAILDPAFARVSYREADRFANRVANALLARCIKRGDRVAMLCENSVEAYLTKLGIAKAGGVAVPINTMMAADVVEHVLRHVDARVAIVDAELWPSGGAAFRAAGVSPIASIGRHDASISGVMSLQAFIADQPYTEPEVRIHGDDIWQILLTSGTTSMPKAVMISHSFSYFGALGQAMSYSRGVPIECDFRVCTFLPVIFHVGDQGVVLGPLLCGGSVVIGRKFDPAAIAQAVTRERPTALWGGSPQLIGEVVREGEAHPDRYDFSSLTVLIYGWAAIPPALTQRMQRLAPHVQLVGIFGQTEAIAFHRFWPARWPELYQRTAPAVNYVGIPSPLLASTVMDADGNSLHASPGVPGEAVYRSPSVTAGYFRDEAATREAFKHGWFHSGDMCQFDEDGLRIMIDRYKDVVKSGGENVSSLRVEAVLAQHPSVHRAAVVGLPDPRWGEAVTGVIVPAPGHAIDEAALIAFCRIRLAGFETPKRIVVMSELPVTVGGKVLKYKLRQMLGSGMAAP
ncbi:MAG: class I adenylate-forming enzyme family protein [Panacagrimonas sp.]